MKSLHFYLSCFVLFLGVSLFGQATEYEIQPIDTTSMKQANPDIVFCQDSTIFVTWEAYIPALQNRVFCVKSINNGASFLPKVEPDPSFATKISPTVDADDAGNPYLTWSDYRNGSVNIRFAKSANGGASFLPSKLVYDQDTLNFGPQVKVSMNGQRIFVAWITLYGDTVTQDSIKLFLSRSTDGGVTFQSAQHIGGNIDSLQYLFSFDISESGDTVVVAWEDRSSGQIQLKYAVSLDSGVSFSIPVVVDPFPASHFSPTLSLFKDSTFIAYTDDGLGNWDIKMASAEISNTPTFSYAYVDSDTFAQEQPNIDIDKLGNFYVSYRSEECQIYGMTYIARARKGNPSFSEDWIGIWGFDNTLSRVAVKDTLHFFAVWEWHLADTSITVFARSVPAKPPGAPQNLLANGANPSPWDTTTKFIVTFVKPYDPSDIDRILFKLGSPPTGNFDTTATFHDTSSTDTSAFTVKDTVEGGEPLFVWLMDGRGYTDYHKNSTVILRVDKHSPKISLSISPDPVKLGSEFYVQLTCNKTLKSIDTCYIVGSHSNSISIEMDRDSLDTDSTSFTKSVILSGLEPGLATLYTVGRDLNDKTGKDSVDFMVEVAGEFLPKKRVYTWPNPAQDLVHLRYYVGRNSDITIEIFTISGKKIKTITTTARGGDIRSETVFDTKNVGSDIYLFRLKATSQNSRESGTVVKRFAIVK